MSENALSSRLVLFCVVITLLYPAPEGVLAFLSCVSQHMVTRVRGPLHHAK
jgi:hypothetical protein